MRHFKTYETMLLNRSSRRKIGMASNPLLTIPDFFRIFPINFAKVAIAEFFWKMQRKTWHSIMGLDVMPLSLKNLLLMKKLNWKLLHRFIVCSTSFLAIAKDPNYHR